MQIMVFYCIFVMVARTEIIFPNFPSINGHTKEIKKIHHGLDANNTIL